MRCFLTTLCRLAKKAKLLPDEIDSNMCFVRTSASTQLPTCADLTSTSTSFLPLDFGVQETIHAGGQSTLSLSPFNTVLK
jgi:hypothetical protein